MGQVEYHVAVDKGEAGSLGLVFGFLTTPKGVAVLLPPQALASALQPRTPSLEPSPSSPMEL